MTRRIITLIGCIVLSLAAGALGALATTPNIQSWYAYLDKPFFNPPNWLFGPVWTILYIMMGLALYYVITTKAKKSTKKTEAYQAFGLQLVLNTTWSVVFFGLHAIEAAIAIILLLLVTIIVTMMKFRPISNHAFWLLTPYLAWVSFATILNIAIAILN